MIGRRDGAGPVPQSTPDEEEDTERAAKTTSAGQRQQASLVQAARIHPDEATPGREDGRATPLCEGSDPTQLLREGTSMRTPTHDVDTVFLRWQATMPKDSFTKAAVLDHLAATYRAVESGELSVEEFLADAPEHFDAVHVRLRQAGQRFLFEGFEDSYGHALRVGKLASADGRQFSIRLLVHDNDIAVALDATHQEASGF